MYKFLECFLKSFVELRCQFNKEKPMSALISKYFSNSCYCFNNEIVKILIFVETKVSEYPHIYTELKSSIGQFVQKQINDRQKQYIKHNNDLKSKKDF